MSDYYISGVVESEARILVFEESDWSIVSNTVINGGGAYNIGSLVSGTKMVVARDNAGEIVGYGSVTPALFIPPSPQDDEWWDGYYDNTYWQPDDPDWAEWDAVNEKWVPAAANDYEVDLAVNASATWDEDYRPTHIKFIIENDPGDLYINLYGTTVTIADTAAVANDTAVNITQGMIWDAAGDIDYFYLYSDDSNSGWAITGIEFYTDSTPDANTATLSYVNVYGTGHEIVFVGDSDLGYETASSTFLNQGAGVYFYEVEIGVPSNATNRFWKLTGLDIWNNTTSQWDDRLDQSYWTGQDGTTWSDGGWITSVANSDMYLTVDGAWASTYPVGTAKIRFTWMPYGEIVMPKK
jgi:hypothetical protein